MSKTYVIAGFIVPPLAWWAVTSTDSFWVSVAFFLSCAVFLPHAVFLFVAVITVDTFLHNGLTDALWVLVMSSAVIAVVAGIGSILNDVVDFASNATKNAKNPPIRDVHHYHHITTDQDLRAEVTDVRREDNPRY